MSGKFILTVGNISQIEEKMSDGQLLGHTEPRIAFVGRSNVGKSSLINALLGSKLAQTSTEPGKTRLLHFYMWQEAKVIFADLPGYGYAKASHEDRNRWAEFIQAYINHDSGLQMACVLLDSRHGPSDLDEDAIRFLSLEGIPVTFVFTKADTLKTQSERVKRKREVEAKLKEWGVSPDDLHWVSVKTKDGLRKLQEVIKK